MKAVDSEKNIVLAPSASSLARIGTASLAQRGLSDLQMSEDADQWLQKASESFSETVEKMTPFLKLGIEKMQEYFESKVYRDLMADYISFLHRAVAASPDYPKALYELAKAYLKGFGVEVDGAQALSLLRRASEFASADELWMMSFDISEGVREKILNAEDLKEAERFCRRAAEQGHAGGQYSLAAMYARGGLFADGDSGLPHSRDLAMYWLRKAAENGEFPPAENEIRHLWKRSRRKAK
jgi:TPR repeat protein